MQYYWGLKREILLRFTIVKPLAYTDPTKIQSIKMVTFSSNNRSQGRFTVYVLLGTEFQTTAPQ